MSRDAITMSTSEELGIHEGLGFIDGKVKHFENCESFEKDQKVPFVGWSEITIPENKRWQNTILKDMKSIHIFILFILMW